MTKGQDWVVRPESFVQYLRDVEGLSSADIRLPARGIMVFGSEDLRLFCRALRARILRWNNRYGLGRAGRTNVVVFRTTIGAPAAAANLEEAIARGLRTLVTFGACGSLRNDLPIGSIVLPTGAYSDEGTSAHYGGKRWSQPDATLLRALRLACTQGDLSVREGATWTTDAPYRESRAKVRSLARRGVVSVEMEASALWQVARVRGAKAASLFVVSDELEGADWNIGFRDPRFLEAKRKAVRVVVNALRGPWR